MDKIENIRINIKKIYALLDDVKNEIESLSSDLQKQTKALNPKIPVLIPSEDELKKKYEEIYNSCKIGEWGTIQQFVNNTNRKVLNLFFRVNNLPLNTKLSKENMVKDLRQFIIQRMEISKELSPLYTGFRR